MKTQNDLVKRLFEYLDYHETTDNGRVYHPIVVSCTRCMMMQEVGELLVELKESIT